MKEDMTNVTAFQSLKSPVPEGEENLCAGRLAPPALSRPKKNIWKQLPCMVRVILKRSKGLMHLMDEVV